ncbi:MAG: hypothetical protein M1822_008194 [Bathelium mastoideum]|nr:MAG: hypothetical protein M1822_008194 [Bathelium mastoideum]
MRKIVEVIGARSESYLEVHSEAKSAADVSTGGSATAIISSQKSEIFSSTLTHFIETPGSEQSTEQDTQVQSLLIPPDDDSRSYGELKAVDKTFPHVKRAFVGGPSLTDKWSNGFEIGFVSFHDSFEELTRYQALEEHDRYVDELSYRLKWRSYN